MAAVPGVVHILSEDSLSGTQHGGHSPRFQMMKLRLQKDEESAVKSQPTAARICIRSHRRLVERLPVLVNCRLQRVYSPCAAQPLPLSAAHVSPLAPSPLHTAFSQWEPLSVCHTGQFSPAPGPLHVLSVDSDHPSFYILLARAHSCSPSGPLLVPVSPRSLLLFPQVELVPLLWAPRVPWTSSDIALTACYILRCLPPPTRLCVL